MGIKPSEKHSLEIFLIVLIALSYLFRTSMPSLKIPFLILFISFTVYGLIHYRKRIISTLKEFFINYYLLIALAFILTLSFFLSNKIYLTVFKDLVNTIILLLIFFISSIVLTGKADLKIYFVHLLRLSIFFAFIISVFQLLALFDIFSDIDYTSFEDLEKGAESIDTNFVLLPVFFGLLSVFYFKSKTSSKLQISGFNVLLVIFSLGIIISGSKRGIALFLIIFLIMLAIIFLKLLKKDKIPNLNSIDPVFFSIATVLIIILIKLFVFNTSSVNKNKTLELIGSRNTLTAKVKIFRNLHRYGKLINSNMSFSEMFWTYALDPTDPDTGWGSRVHKTVFPLTGNNVEIVPENVKGYLMDNTCDAEYAPVQDLCEAHTFLVNLNTRKGDSYKASVFCFVSDSSNISSVYFGVGAASIENKTVSGNVKSLYNLEKKNMWQKLEIDFDCADGSVPIYMSIWKVGAKDLSHLKGYVIFAYPDFEKNPKSINKIESKALYNTYKKKSIKVTEKNMFYIQKRAYSGMFCFSDLISSQSWQIQDDSDPIRSWASRFISEDTTYYPYKSNIALNSIQNSFIADRYLRGEFALKIFSKEYNFRQKLFGGGFNFLNWFGYYFLHDKTQSDYPHNPFLHILLYSGIVGLLIYCFFLYKVFYYYIKYIKEYPLLFIFFLITFFFAVFSSGSPFDPPVFGFFSILPFFIHSVHKKSLAETKT